MTNLWDAERTLGLAEARALIEAQFPVLAPVRLRELGEGWDNRVFEVNERWAFRFPRRAVAVGLLANELRILEALAPRLPLPIPVPHFRGEPGAAFPWPFAGYTLLPGRIAATVALDDAARAALAVPLARFLRALHGLPVAFAHAHGVPDDEIERLNARRRAALTDTRLDALCRAGVLADRRPFDELLAQDAAHAPCATSLVHGDLHAWQLLLDDAGALAGVIDWGDVNVGDPGTDLAVAHTLLPPAAHAAFLAGYGAVSPGRWFAARQRATWHSIALAAQGLDTGDAPRLRDALRALAYILQAGRGQHA